MGRKDFDEFDYISRVEIFPEEILKDITRAVFRQPPGNYKLSDRQALYRPGAIKIFFDAIHKELASLLQRNYHAMTLHDMQRVQRMINDLIVITKTKRVPIRLQNKVPQKITKR